MRNVWDEFTSKMKKNRIEYRTDLGFDRLTTLGVGGKIKTAVFPESMRQLIAVLRVARRLGVKTVVIGRGSNMLASDDPFDGLVVITTHVKKFCVRGTRAKAQCGVSSAALGNALASKGLSGGEFLCCLPGTVGGAVVGNAGCFGEETKDIVARVTFFKNGKVKRLKGESCAFQRRFSLFKESGYVILSVKMRFNKSTERNVSDTVAHMRQVKASTQPLGERSAGCALFHPSVAVSRLIDEMGFKGLIFGGAKVSEKHAGFVVNIDKATALDIYLLIEYIRYELWQRYGICAQREICLINFGKVNDDIFAKRQE